MGSQGSEERQSSYGAAQPAAPLAGSMQQRPNCVCPAVFLGNTAALAAVVGPLPELQIACGFLASLSDNLEGYLLAVVEPVQPGGMHRSDVHKHVLATVIGLN